MISTGRGRQMASYRVFFIDDDGHIRGVRELACANDEDALALAHAVAEGQQAEVWNLTRLVARLEADRRRA